MVNFKEWYNKQDEDTKNMLGSKLNELAIELFLKSRPEVNVFPEDHARTLMVVSLILSQVWLMIGLMVDSPITSIMALIWTLHVVFIIVINIFYGQKK